MYIVSAVPIARGRIGKSTYSYFSKNELTPGTIVAAPFRKKTIPVLVVETTSLQNARTVVRSATYALKGIRSTKTTQPFRTRYIEGINAAANYFVTTPGALLNGTAPTPLLTKLPNAKKDTVHTDAYDVSVVSGTDDTRYDYYVRRIQTLFKEKHSVFVIAPTQARAEILHRALGKVVPEHTILLHAGLGEKEVVSRWQSAVSGVYPQLVIMTPRFLALPRHDLGAIIIEEESSRHYFSRGRPHIDYRVVIEYVARAYGISCIYGGLFLRPDTLERVREGGAHLQASAKKKIAHEPQVVVVPMDTEPKDVVFGKTVRDALEHTGRIFVLSGRKALYPLSVCGDCGKPVTCKRCSRPVAVYEKKDGTRTFRCHSCRRERDTYETCASCGSWKLVPLGIGIDHILKELQAIAPTRPILRIDGEHVTTHKEALNVQETWLNSPTAILLGTDMAFPYLDTPDISIVTTLEALAALPDFRTGERIMATLETVRHATKTQMFIQTRHLDQTLLDAFTAHRLDMFYDRELAERKDGLLPPWTTLIKLTIYGSPRAVSKEAQELINIFHAYNPVSYPAFISVEKNKSIEHVLLTVPKNTWPDATLIQKLRELPPQIDIAVDPETTL